MSVPSSGDNPFIPTAGAVRPSVRSRFHQPSDEERGEIREKLIGLGERSIRKTYYPELKERLEELTRFRALLDRSGDAIFLIEATHGLVVDANAAAKRLLGLAEAAYLELREEDAQPPAFMDLLPTAVAEQVRTLLDSARLTAASATQGSVPAEQEPLSIRTTLTPPGGASIPLEISLTTTGFHEEIFAVAVARDISDRVRAEEETHMRFAAMEGAMDGMAILAQDLTVLYANRALAEIHGLENASGLIGKSLAGMLCLDERDKLPQVILAALAERGRFHGETCGLKAAKGIDVPEELSLELALKTLTGSNVLCVVRDVTDRKRSERALFFHAFYDGLTGLSNRAHFMDRVKLALRSAKRQGFSRIAVLLLDLDRFKVVNDSLGHHLGDALLQEVGRRLSRVVRQEDTVARFGGDEFALLISEVEDLLDATRLIARIEDELAAPYTIDGHQTFTSASIGVVIHPDPAEDPEAVVKNADIAMYRAKRKGKARHEVFNPDMAEAAANLLELENGMRAGLPRGEFISYFQPIIRLRDQSVAGFEALVRWNHPTRGIIPPGQFIPLAEETGLILEIGALVLSQAVAWLTDLPASGNGQAPYISVNLSSKQLSHANLVEDVRGVLDYRKLSPRQLKLEVTESLLMENPERAATALGLLSRAGIQLAIDDFGTGYSSLAYLHRFPFDILKIDRTFVSGREAMKQDAARMDIPATVVALAERLRMDVVTEGIETQEQATRLTSLGCTYGQGYFYAKPMCPEEARAYYREHAR